MEFDFSLVALLDFLAFVQGTLLGVLLMLKAKEHFPSFFLGLFLFSYSTELLISIFFDIGIYPLKPSLIYLPVTFYYLFMPSLYLYVKSLTAPIQWKKYIWLFVPAMMEFVLFIILFVQPSAVKLEQLMSGKVVLFYSIYIDIAMLYAIIYAIFTIRLIYQHRQRVKDYYADMQGKLLDWVRWVCIFIILINLTLLASNIVPPATFSSIIYPLISAINVVFIFWVALSGFRQKNISLPSSPAAPPHEKTTPPSIKDDSAEFQKILSFIQQEKSYAKADLHLVDLAQQLHLSQRRLSELINQEARLNFNQFINRLRVEEAKKLLVDEAYAHLNILGIGYEVGFNSKTTFYAAFKNETGMTPSKFQQQASPISKPKQSEIT